MNRRIYISDGRLSLAEYLMTVSPVEFFDEKAVKPKLTQTVLSAVEQLDEDDLALTLANVRRLLRK